MLLKSSFSGAFVIEDGNCFLKKRMRCRFGLVCFFVGVKHPEMGCSGRFCVLVWMHLAEMTVLYTFKN